MSYLKGLWIRLQTWRTFQTYPESVRFSLRAPSETFYKYPPYHNFGGKAVLNVGCGRSVYKATNVVNLDCIAGEGVNIVVTDNKLPFADETFDYIIANHVMEHIPNWFETMKEMARVLKVGGTIEIWIPPISSDSAFGYRDHINRIGVASFFGCKTYKRSGSNLSADEETKDIGFFRDLRLFRASTRMIITWWTTVAPDWALRWMANYLRNVVSEEGFFFKKEAPDVN